MKCAEVGCSANRDVMETLSGGVTEGSWAKEGVMWGRGAGQNGISSNISHLQKTGELVMWGAGGRVRV